MARAKGRKCNRLSVHVAVYGRYCTMHLEVCVFMKYDFTARLQSGHF